MSCVCLFVLLLSGVVASGHAKQLNQTWAAEMRKYKRKHQAEHTLSHSKRRPTISVDVDTPQWAKEHPLAIFCKKFSHLSRDHFNSVSMRAVGGGITMVPVPCIPALILPVALDPHDFLSRLFASIDQCITNMYIFKSDEVDTTAALQALDKRLVQNIIVRSRPLPNRVTLGWNSVGELCSCDAISLLF